MNYKEEQQVLVDAIIEFMIAVSETTSTDFVASIAEDTSLNESVTVHFLDEDGNNRVMDTLQDLADFLLEHTGRHYCITNNSPTDGTALIFIDRHMDRPFNKCHFKEQFIRRFETWRSNPTFQTKLTPELLIFETLQEYLDRACEGTEAWKDRLCYNEEIWFQIMSWARYDL